MLLGKREISQQQFDQATAAATAANATVTAREAALLAAQAQVQQAQSRIEQANAEMQQCAGHSEQVAATAGQGEVRRRTGRFATSQRSIRRNSILSYTTIVAPVDGVVGKRSVQVGQNVAPGQDLMAIVPLRDIWVTANFKETQLEHMQPGQPVKVKVDTYGGRKWDGHVTSIGGATGAKYSLLPPENATGNYVKVVQRIPVRIDFDDNDKPDFNQDGLLRPGMSVVPDVKVSVRPENNNSRSSRTHKGRIEHGGRSNLCGFHLEAALQPVDHRPHGDAGDVHGGARHLHRQRRPAAHRGRTRAPGRTNPPGCSPAIWSPTPSCCPCRAGSPPSSDASAST